MIAKHKDHLQQLLEASHVWEKGLREVKSFATGHIASKCQNWGSKCAWLENKVSLLGEYILSPEWSMIFQAGNPSTWWLNICIKDE